jgi:GNAT superfamily N-acetyltransferase
LTRLTFRSKAVWSYDAAFLRDAAPDLTVTGSKIASGRVYVAEAGGAVRGFYGLSSGYIGLELDFLFVEPGSLRQGIGARLFRHTVWQAARLGWTHFTIVSDPSAAPFYEKRGAARIGEVASFVRPRRMLPLLRMDVGARGICVNLILERCRRVW